MTQLSIQISSNGKYFEFEQQLNADLSCPPLAARQKLDALGVKISRNQWLALEMNERRQFRDMPARSNAEKRQFAEFVNRILSRSVPVNRQRDSLWNSRQLLFSRTRCRRQLPRELASWGTSWTRYRGACSITISATRS